MKNILWLHESHANISHVGAKAANLIQLARAGLPVPAGFCVTLDAWRNASANDGAPSSQFAEDVLSAYWRLCAMAGDDPHVAVRSSAVAEDGAQASFAGQFETFLNVTGPDALFASIARCWVSSNSARVETYRNHHTTTQRDAGMGVIVQHMLKPEVSGVLFSADPLSGNPQRLVLEVVCGVAADYVSGLVTPTRLVFDRVRRAVIESESMQRLPLHFQTEQVWQPLIDLALRAERALRVPQDVEWAYSDGRFWILQSRPIKMSPAYPERWNLTRANIGEVMPGVVTPLTLSTFIGALRAHERVEQDVRPSEMLTIVEGRAYIDVQRLWDSYSGIVGVRAATVLSKGLGCPLDDYGRELSARSSQGFVTSTIKSIYVWLELLTQAWVRPRLERTLQELSLQLETLRAATLEVQSSAETWAQIESLLAVNGQAFLLHMQSSFIALCAYAVTRDQVVTVCNAATADRVVASPDPASSSAEALANVLTTLVAEVSAAPELRRLIDTAHGDRLLETLNASACGRAFVERVTACARTLGDRSVQEFELSAPRWSEEPRLLLAAVRASLSQDGQAQLAQAKTTTYPSDSMQDEWAGVFQQAHPIRRMMLRRTQRAFVTYSKVREQTKSVLMMCFAELRRRFLRLATQLLRDGRLAEAHDIFFLTLDEVRELIEITGDAEFIAARIQTRRAEYSAHRSSETQRDTTGALAPNGAASLAGTAVSSGRLSGRARRVADPARAQLQAGEVLIAESTDPGWMPLFLVAGAIVTETGGMLSHTATLARELHKPAVFSVAGAMHLIHDGQWITVDGEKGRVFVHEAEAA